MIVFNSDNFGFISDEKCIRILTPTKCFAHYYGEPYSSMSLPFAAMVPPLTLSNKIIHEPGDVFS